MSRLDIHPNNALLVEEDTVFLLHKDNLYTLRLPNPTRHLEIRMKDVKGLIAIWQGGLLVERSLHRLVMIRNGTVRWVRKCQGYSSAYEGTIVMSHKDSIHVLDWNTGKTLQQCLGHPNHPSVKACAHGIIVRHWVGSATFIDYATLGVHAFPRGYWLDSSRTYLNAQQAPNLAPWPPFLPWIGCIGRAPRYTTYLYPYITDRDGRQRRFQCNVGLLRTRMIPDLLTILLQL